jgi:SpoVK/Ycf46/Vps4 family AAA+-type ATPase
MSKLDSLRSALAHSPDNVPLLVLFGQAALEEFSADEARGAFERALALDLKHSEAALGLARSLHLQGKASEAILRVEALVSANPRFAEAHRWLARWLLDDGNASAARASYERALAVEPTLRDPAFDQALSAAESSPGAKKVPITSTGSAPATAPTEAEAGDLERVAEYELPTEVERPSLTFADVGGMDEVKEQVRMKILFPLQQPDLFKAYGKKAGGGVLLYGPPGCGKTLISRAVAGEIKAKFLSVGIHQVIEMWLGNSEKNLHGLFEYARRNAPAVLFFDEVDALAANRADLRASAGRTLINQFLAEFDATQGANDGVLVLGATNAPWHLDSAFLRPGRFDRVLFVPPPDEPARAAIAAVMARDKPVAKFDALALAKRTKDFSGADLRAVFDHATERSLVEAMKRGRVIPLTTDDLARAAKEVKPSTRSWFESARNHALYANQSGFYDDVLVHLGLKK